jgi:enterochelin esterase-like enzyme
MKQDVSRYDKTVQPIEFVWRETDPAHPAQDVLVRLIGLDDVYDDRELAPFLLKRAGAGEWRGVIDLPDGLRSGYQFCPVRDRRIPPSGLDDDGWAAVMASGVADAANPHTIWPVYGNDGHASILELPGASPQPWCERRPGVPRGEVRTIDTGAQWPPRLHIYTPPGTAPSPLPVGVLFDAQAWVPADVMATFDNLIADDVIAPMVFAMIGYPFGPARVRGLTRPAVHVPYLMDQLMPCLVRDFAATADPKQTVVIGQSLGGLAAVNLALHEPSRFGNVISQSGSFWWPGGDGELSGKDTIATAAATRSPVRFWLEAGEFERQLVQENRGLHTALARQGSAVSYREYQGGHDFACWRGGIGDGLAALLGS